MLADKIRMLRISQGLSQTDFAKRLFVTPGAVNQWEKGKTSPDTARLMSMAREFSVPLSYFSDDEEKETELSTDRVISQLENVPKTPEARAVSWGMDKLPKEQRELILNMVTAMFPNKFTKGDDDET